MEAEAEGRRDNGNGKMFNDALNRKFIIYYLLLCRSRCPIELI